MAIETSTGAAAQFNRDVFSVSRLNREVRELLEGHFGPIWIEGEISNIARPRSGHLYFSLKDNDAQVRCAMFLSRNSLLGFEPDNGIHAIAHARVGLYEARGDYQLIVEHMEPAGEGMLRIKFERLKRRLAAEGLFDADAKRVLPQWPRAIGVVSSPSGAALRDILDVLKRRSPITPVIIYPCGVQGQSAASEIVTALHTAGQRRECDVLIVARGGGSLEDLWAFNDEAVARAIHACKIPVISGVGHEIDFTIADLVADVRAPTPSVAAELATHDCKEALKIFASLQRRLTTTTLAVINGRENHLQHIQRRLISPGRRIEAHNQRLDELSQRLPHAVNRELTLRSVHLDALMTRIEAQTPVRRISLARERLRHFEIRVVRGMRTRLSTLTSVLQESDRALRAVSPAATLERGYAIVTDGAGKIVRNARDHQRGDRVTARLAKGKLDCTVESALPDDPLSSLDSLV